MLIVAKVQSGHVQFAGAQDGWWQYVGKFGYAIGTGTYEIRLKTQNPAVEEIVVDMDIFLDQEWSNVDKLPVCNRAVEARKSHRRLAIGQQGSWSEWHGGSLQQVIRPHVWYFALSSCAPLPSSYDFEYEIRWRQFDRSELSIELRPMPAASFLGLLGLSLLLSAVAIRVEVMRRSCGRIHPVVRAMLGAAALQWLSQALHLLHLVVYKENGIGLHSADVLAEVLGMLSQALISVLLLAIAQGHSLRIPGKKEENSVVSLAAAVAAFHILLVLCGKLQGETHYKFHDQEGVVGWLLLLARLSIFGRFLAKIQTLHDASGYKLQHFLHRFKLAGSAYFLAFPTIFLTVKLLAPYFQHPVLQLGLLMMQTGASLWLAELFLSKGEYFEVSELSYSLLPGGAGHESPCKDD